MMTTLSVPAADRTKALGKVYDADCTSAYLKGRSSVAGRVVVAQYKHDSQTLELSSGSVDPVRFCGLSEYPVVAGRDAEPAEG